MIKNDVFLKDLTAIAGFNPKTQYLDNEFKVVPKPQDVLADRDNSPYTISSAFYETFQRAGQKALQAVDPALLQKVKNVFKQYQSQYAHTRKGVREEYFETSKGHAHLTVGDKPEKYSKAWKNEYPEVVPKLQALHDETLGPDFLQKPIRMIDEALPIAQVAKIAQFNPETQLISANLEITERGFFSSLLLLLSRLCASFFGAGQDNRYEAHKATKVVVALSREIVCNQSLEKIDKPTLEKAKKALEDFKTKVSQKLAQPYLDRLQQAINRLGEAIRS